MKRDITDTIPPLGDDEGTCYDVERAREEGLHEEFALFTITGVWGSDPMATQLISHSLDEKQIEALYTLFPDLGANLEPGRLVELPLIFKYRYGYGEEIAG